MIEFDRASYDAIVEHAHEGAPEEVCGVFGGEYGEERSRVETVHRVRNVAESPETRYYIDPEQQLELIDRIEEAGRDVVGFYHSHPAGPARPSETDVDRATWPGLSYVIVALADESSVGAWRWNGEDERFEEEVVRVGG